MDNIQSFDLSYLQNWLDNSPDLRLRVCSTCKIPHVEDIFPSPQLTAIKKKQQISRRHKLSNNKNKQSTKQQQYSPSKTGNRKKMAPISEKRTPPIINESTKENISGSKILYDKLNNKGPEILDFRESWLQEIEIYKDHSKNAQQLLTQHNHLHTADGCLRESVKDAVKTAVEPTKRRFRVRSHSDQHDASKSQLQKECDEELVLKRAREESYSPSSNNSHHINHNHVGPILKRKSASPQPQPKIIVNPYHASLLSSSATAQLLDKPKIIINSPVAVSTTTTTAAVAATAVTTSSAAANSAQSSGPVCLNGISNKKHKQRSKSSTKYFTKDLASKDNVSPATAGPHTTASSTQTVPATANVHASVILSQTPIITDDPVNEIFIHHSDEKDQADDKSDDGSKFDDDEDDFGDIDGDDVYGTSSDSEDDYKGYAYLLDSDEEKDDGTESDIISLNSSATTSTQYTTPKSPLTPSLFRFVPPYLTFSSHVEKGPPMPLELHKILKWKHSNVMPRIVKRVVLNSGFRLIKKTNDWMGTWEKHMKSPCFKAIRSHQKYNHLPGTFKIGRKDSAWKNLRQYMGKHGKNEFGFMQKTFVLPQDLEILKKAWPRYAKKCTKWIIKPPASARGTGIKVVSRWSEIPKQRPLIVQKYIERPLLINGNKFDLRLYVVVTSINPLRIFLHTDGLARFASVQYSDKLDTLSDRCMHLTNYSINKLSINYARNEDFNACQGHKWTLKSLWSYFRQKGINTKRLWGTLRNLVIRTVLSGEGCLNRMFKLNVNSRYCCYELFGFDVLLDENLVPWLLEVNISPSLHSDLPLDLHVKGPLIQAVLNTAMYQVPPKLSDDQEMMILKEYDLKGPLCYDRRLYTMCLSPEETKKHNQFTNKSIECREDYLNTILEDLTPDDLRCLIIAEDELARSVPMERIFPGSESHLYLKFIDGPRYYNRLLDAWESKYGKNRHEGIQLLQKHCDLGRHLQVPPTALKRESNEKDIAEQQNEDNCTQSLTKHSNEKGNLLQDVNDSSTLKTNFCSKQMTIPQKQVNVDICRGPRPITVEIK